MVWFIFPFECLNIHAREYDQNQMYKMIQKYQFLKKKKYTTLNLLKHPHTSRKKHTMSDPEPDTSLSSKIVKGLMIFFGLVLVFILYKIYKKYKMNKEQKKNSLTLSYLKNVSPSKSSSSSSSSTSSKSILHKFSSKGSGSGSGSGKDLRIRFRI